MAIKSVDIYCSALDYLGKRGRLLGIDALRSDFNPFNFLSFVLILDAVTYTLVTIYCLFEFSRDLEALVFCLVTYGFGTQVLKINVKSSIY